jgi:hypothetical protein
MRNRGNTAADLFLVLITLPHKSALLHLSHGEFFQLKLFKITYGGMKSPKYSELRARKGDLMHGHLCRAINEANTIP